MLQAFLLLLVVNGGFAQAPRPVPQRAVARPARAIGLTGFQFLPSSRRYLQRMQLLQAQKAQSAQSLPVQRPAPASARIEIPICGTFSNAVLVVDGSGVHFQKASDQNGNRLTTWPSTEQSQ